MTDLNKEQTAPDEGDEQTVSSNREALDRSLLSGIAWTGGIRWVSQILSWVGTLLVARLLVPQDFGLLGMAMVYTGFVNLVNEFGIGAAVIQRQSLRDSQITGLAGFSVALGAFLFVLSAALSGPVAIFFHEPKVQGIVLALSINFLVSSLAIIPRALLARDLQFRVLAMISGTQTIVTTIVTLVLAWMGFAYWSLVVGNLLSTFGTTAAVFWLRPVVPRWPRPFGEIVSELKFGWNVVVGRVSWYAYSNADFAIVGRVLGTATLGFYSIGWTLANLPVEKISVMVMRVTPPVLAKVQDDPPALRRYVRLITEGISLVTFPAAVGLILVAHDFVLVALGEKWLPAVVPLQLLLGYAAFQSVAALLPQVLVVTDHTKLDMFRSILGVLVLPACFVVGTHWGLRGVALTWVLVYPVMSIPFHLLTTFRIIEMRLMEYLRSWWPAVSSCTVMAIAVLIVQEYLPAGESLLGLGVTIPVGAVAYVAAVWLLHRKRVSSSVAFIRSVRTRSRARSQPA